MTNGSRTEAAGGMVLERIRIRNYRCILDAELQLEPDVTVLVGLNDVGKTALLAAIEDYGQLSAQGSRYAAGDQDLRGEGAPSEFEAVWRDPPTGDAYEHLLSAAPGSSETLRGPGWECVWEPRGRLLTVGGGTHRVPGIPIGRSLGSIGPSLWADRTEVPTETAAMLGVTSHFRVGTPHLFQPDAVASPSPLDDTRVRRSGFGLAAVLGEMIGRRDGRFEQLEAALQRLFPFCRRVRARAEAWDVVPRRAADEDEALALQYEDAAPRPPRLLQQIADQESRRVIEVELESGQWVHASTVSSGLLLALAYLAATFGADEGTMLVLEEPENGLSPTIAVPMMGLLLETAAERRQQLLMTTHNAYWLDLIGPAGVRVVTRDPETGTRIHQEPENLQRILDEDYQLSEVMWLGGPEELLRPRKGTAP